MPVKLSAVLVTILHCSVCASKAVCSSCHHTALQYVCPQGCLQFTSPYCITVCIPARLSEVHVTILHYSVCASKSVCSSCHHTALQCVCQQVCLKFMSPYCITVCVCQQGCLQFLSPYCITVCVCQQGCLQFVSPWFMPDDR